MPKDKKNRLVYVLKYMWEHTDEDNQTTLNQIVQHLMTLGIEATPRTVGYDLDQLVELGFDIVCIRSTQNRYFLGSRTFEIPELKLMIDAIQAAHFISAERAEQMIGKLALLASSEQAEVLKRNLYVTKQKGDNRNLLYTVDVLNMAINRNVLLSVIMNTIEVVKSNSNTVEQNTYLVLTHLLGIWTIIM